MASFGKLEKIAATELRSVTLNDVDQILEIYSPYVTASAVTFDTEVPTPERLAAKITRQIEKYPWLVLEEGGLIQGYTYANLYRERAAYRWSVEVSIYVRAQAQRRGFGKRLYSELFRQLKAQGYCMAFAGITLPNVPSVALHELCGFRQVGSFPNAGFKFGQWRSVGWWGLELNIPQIHPQETTL